MIDDGDGQVEGQMEGANVGMAVRGGYAADLELGSNAGAGACNAARWGWN